MMIRLMTSFHNRTGDETGRTDLTDQLIPLGHIDESDALGFSLHRAALHGNKRALKKVLDKGIHVDYPNDEGQSPLFCACYACSEGAVDYLLSAGANPNEKCNSGLTPVIVAGYAGRVKILIKLLNAGGDLRLHDNQGRNIKDWAMLQPTPKKRMKMLEFLDKARLFAMSSSGQDLLMKKAPSNVLHRAHHRQNSITKIIRNRIGRHSVHDKFEKMASNQHSVGFGHVYADGTEETGFLSAIPLTSESSLRHDPHGETYNNGAFAVMESMWWDYTEVTIKRLHRDIDAYHGGVVDLLINEIEHIGKLRHPHILTLMGVCQNNNLDGLVLLYERIGKGSLFNYLHQKMERLPSQTIQDIAVQMCNAIIFIHLRGLVHCAITSHAISVINLSTFKLGNFEYMIESSKCEMGKKSPVTTNTNEDSVYNWLAPEVIIGLPPSYYCDMYSYCAVLWELFHGDIPWEGQSSEAIRAQYSKGNSLRIYQGKIAEFYKVILEYGLELDPNKRKLSFLHVRDLLLAAPKDARYYLKTHFQNLHQNEHNSRTKGSQAAKPTAPPADTRKDLFKSSEFPNTSKVVDLSLRDRQERRRKKEKERAKQLEDSDIDQNYDPERQKYRREEENRRLKKKREGEIKRRAEEKKNDQFDYKTETRQVKGQNVDDHNNNCSSLQNCWNVTRENLDYSPKKAAEPKLFKTEGLDWEIFPKEENEEFLYTVQVTRHPSPKKQQCSPVRPNLRERQTDEKVLRKHTTPPKKRVIEVTSSEETVTSTTENSSELSQSVHRRELGKPTASMGRFSYLKLDNHQRPRSSGVKPACHTTGALIRDEYSTLGKLTTAGTLYAMYNEHSSNLPEGQLEHTEPPNYATLRKRLLDMKQASAPPIRPEKTWFGGKGSVRDLAKAFQQYVQEHDFHQSVLNGKLTADSGLKQRDTGESSTGQENLNGNHAKPRLLRGMDKDDKESVDSLSTVTMSDCEVQGDAEGKRDTDTTSTFTSTSLTDSKGIHLSTSTESDLVTQWVDHELRKIKKNLSKQMIYENSQKETEKTDERNHERSPEVFETYHVPDTGDADAEDSSTNRVSSSTHSDEAKASCSQHLEAGDQLKESEMPEEFYFDDELYASRGKKSTRIYFDSEDSPPSVISESPTTLPMDTVLKANSMSSVDDRASALSSIMPKQFDIKRFLVKKPGQTNFNNNIQPLEPEAAITKDIESDLTEPMEAAAQKQSGNRRKLSRIPTSKSRLVPKTKSPEAVYSNIVTIRSSLEQAGLHQVTHQMKNLKTKGTKTLVNDTVNAQKVITTIRAAN